MKPVIELSKKRENGVISKSIEKISGLFKNNGLLKGIILISSGALIAQSVTFLVTPVISRMYSPSDFGVLVMFSSIISILLAFTSLRYEFALPLVKDNKDAVNLLALCFLLIPGIIGALLASYVLVHDYLSKVFALNVIDQNLSLFVLWITGASLYQVLSYWAVRDRDYLSITTTRLYQNIGGSSTKVLLGFLAFGSLGLLIGEIVSQIAGCGKLWQAAYYKYKRDFCHISYQNMKAAAIEYSRFPKYSCISSAINILALQIPALFIINIYGLEAGGLYSFAYMVLVLPGSIIGNAISQVFMGEVSALIKESPGKIRAFYIGITKRMTLFLVPLILAISVSAPFWFPHIFGERWVLAGWYCLPLALVVAPGLIISPTTCLSYYGHNDWQLLFDAGRTLLIISAFTLGYLARLDVMLLLLIYGIIMVTAYLACFFINLKAIDRLAGAP